MQLEDAPHGAYEGEQRRAVAGFEHLAAQLRGKHLLEVQRRRSGLEPALAGLLGEVRADHHSNLMALPLQRHPYRERGLYVAA